ncbi:hypothetical protein WAE31_19625 (plasmid) [Xanthomonas axonopodis pv. vasculorum]
MQRLAIQPPHRFHHACAIGHRNAPVCGRHLPEHNAQVMKIERTGMQAHADLTACRLPRIWQCNRLQRRDAGGMAKTNGLHGNS